MEKIKFIIYLTIIFFVNIVFSQDYKLGKVTLDELKQDRCAMDTSAVAEYIFSKGKTYIEYSQTDGFKIITEVENKIKIYKKEGYSYGNYEIPFYIENNSTKEQISFSNAITYNLVGDKIEKTKLKSEGEFEEQVNKNWGIKKITMPNVKEGSIIEYKYVIRSPFISSFPIWEFEKKIPVLYSEYFTQIPEYFIYNSNIRGGLNPIISVDKKKRTITLREIEHVQGKGKYETAVKSNFVSTNIDFEQVETKYILNSISSFNDEVYVNNIKNYTSSISHELAATRYPNQDYKNYALDWENVVETIYDDNAFGGELNKTNYFEVDFEALLNNINLDEQKISVIYNFVKAKMNWNGYMGYYTDNGVKNAYKNNIGNVADINLMLIAMLRYGGINANPILVSTRLNGIPVFPNRNGYNYVIAGVELDNKTIILLDATNKNASPNIIPERAMNWFGRMIRKDGTSEMVDLYPKKNSIENVSMLAELQTDGTIKGKQRKQLTDYYAFLFRNENGNRNQENYIEELEKTENFSLVEEYKLDNLNDLTKPIIETYSFTSNSLVDIIGSKMYFSPMLFHQITENPFKAENRLYPVDFNFPIKDSYTFSIKIPEGYVLESKPEPINLVMEENMGLFKYTVAENMGTIQFACSLEINTPIIESAYYQHLKEFFNQIVLKQNEKIVLIKK
ncbi:DUF3857 domain-containing protein [Flavobacterium celericrescens]|uniref:DUF3857 domain-containing protein n=1 Tax=Flavobacterium celericrescens TaxID=2709780 RepID=A0ABX0IHL4_9FLAO|nr:DUF3857 domain-containing protein [Flavobacterium celericrescens]NHM05369.1 DUF3857 domain-containing protein [Flavobacterium celericrescens]